MSSPFICFLLFSHLRLTRWRMAAPSWDSESMLMFKTNRFPRRVLVHFFRFYFLFVRALDDIDQQAQKGAEVRDQKKVWRNIFTKTSSFYQPKSCHQRKQNDEVVFRRKNTKILTVSIMSFKLGSHLKTVNPNQQQYRFHNISLWNISPSSPNRRPC